MTFLIVANERDLTTDFIVRELHRRGHPFLRLNTDRLIEAKISFDPCTAEFEILYLGKQTTLNRISAAYFRRPELPAAIENLDHSSKAYVLAEWNALLKALYLTVGHRWFSHPKDILLAEDKPGQLGLATSLGFNVPDTIITNDIDRAQMFSRAGPMIAKPLRQASIEEGGADRVVFTSEVHSFKESDRAALQLAPVIFQRRIPKKLDLRATVVGERVFCAAIHSQDDEETKVDWRRGQTVKLRHEVFDLPHDVSSQCIEFVKRQNLRFGAIDLVLDDHDVLWFLECNPNGQWAWIENRTGMPIAASIVDELEGITPL